MSRARRAVCVRSWALAALVCVSSLAAVGVPASARATIVVEESLAQLTEEAAVVALGEVLSVDSRWEEVGGSKVILTRVVIATERGLKGAAQGEAVAFWTLGGQVDGIGQRVTGEPSFRVGERALVFLQARGDQDPRLWVSGMAQGAFRVVTSDAGAEVAVRDTSGLALAEVKAHWDPSTGRLSARAQLQPEALDRDSVQTLPTLLTEIERLLAAQR